MKAITLTQPWASLMALKDSDGRTYKCCETRSWTPPAALIGQAVLIHAGSGLGGFKREPDERVGARELEARYHWLLRHDGPIRWALLHAFGLPTDASAVRVADCLPRGMIVAEGILHKVLPSELAVCALTERCPRELEFGNYAPGRFAWGFRSLTAVGPIVAQGKQSLWDVPEPIAQALADLALSQGRDHP